MYLLMWTIYTVRQYEMEMVSLHKAFLSTLCTMVFPQFLEQWFSNFHK